MHAQALEYKNSMDAQRLTGSQENAVPNLIKSSGNTPASIIRFLLAAQPRSWSTVRKCSGLSTKKIGFLT